MLSKDYEVEEILNGAFNFKNQNLPKTNFSINLNKILTNSLQILAN